MVRHQLSYNEPVTLVGGGALDPAMLDDAMAIAPVLIAADGAADRLLDLGHVPVAVIGDMDSISRAGDLPPDTRLIELQEQETTDFEKCLYTVSSPLYLAAGFTGRRTDHTLAAFHALLRHPGKSVVLIGEEDVIANVPAGHEIRLDLAIGDRVSFVPLAPIRGTHSAGLAWSINGLEMAMGTQIGTSNRVVGRDVRFSFDRPGALVLLERHALLPLVRALAD